MLSAPVATPLKKKTIGATIRIGPEIQCLPFAGFFSCTMYIYLRWLDNISGMNKHKSQTRKTVVLHIDLEICRMIAILFQFLCYLLDGIMIVIRHILGCANIAMDHFLGGVILFTVISCQISRRVKKRSRARVPIGGQCVLFQISLIIIFFFFRSQNHCHQSYF